MSTEEKVRTEVVDVTPEMAEQFLSNTLYEHQRALKEWHVKELADYMRTGTFNPYTALRFNVVGERHFLVDGQHRLWAVIQSNTTQQFIIVTVWKPDMESVVHEYINIDTGALRSLKDAFDTMGLPGKFDLPSSRISMVNTAAKLIERGLTDLGGRGQAAHSKDPFIARSREMAQKRVEEWAPYAYKYLRSIKGHREITRMLEKLEVFTIGMLTTRYQGDKATAFWSSVAMNNGLKLETPEWQMVKYLYESRMRRGPETIFLRKIAAIWNAYYNELPRYSKVYARELDLPILVEGTPFKGR